MIYQWFLESNQIKQMCGHVGDYPAISEAGISEAEWITRDDEWWARMTLRRITDSGDRQR